MRLYAFDMDEGYEYVKITRPDGVEWVTGSLETMVSRYPAFADSNGGLSISAPGNGTDANFHVTMYRPSYYWGYGSRWSYGGFCATVSIECPNGKAITQGAKPTVDRPFECR